MDMYDKNYLIRNGIDVCTYIRKIALSLIITTVLSFAASMMIGLFILPALFWFIHGVTSGFYMPDIFDIILGTMIIWLPIAATIAYYSDDAFKIMTSSTGTPIKNTSSFKAIATQYWKFKDKYCVILKIV